MDTDFTGSDLFVWSAFGVSKGFRHVQSAVHKKALTRGAWEMRLCKPLRGDALSIVTALIRQK
jgi:hypothetical protein